MRFFAAVALLCVLASSNAIAQAPYDFRGAKLGMMLDEFRTLPFPDPVSHLLGSEWTATVTLVCTGDKKISGYDPTAVSSADRAVGAIDCLWMIPPDGVGYPRWTPATIRVGDFGSIGVIYSFMPTAEGSPALRQILVRLSARVFASVVTALTQRFGEPAKTEAAEVQNGFGNKFPSANITWENDASTLYVVERSGEVSQMALLYTHKALDTQYRAALEATKGPPKI